MTARSPHFNLRSFVFFVGVGGCATGVQYAVAFCGVWFAQMSLVSASSLGFGLGAVANYVLNARLTFRSDQSHWRTAPRFVLTCTAGLLLNAACLYLLTQAGLHAVPAQILSTLCVLLWNYTINALWTFRKDRVLS